MADTGKDTAQGMPSLAATLNPERVGSMPKVFHGAESLAHAEIRHMTTLGDVHMIDSFEKPAIADAAAQAVAVAAQVKLLKEQRPGMVEYLLADVAGDYTGTAASFSVWAFWYFRRNVHMDDLRETGAEKYEIKDWIVTFCNVPADDAKRIEVIRKKLGYRRDKGAEIEGQQTGGSKDGGKVTELFEQIEKYLFGGKDKAQTRVARLSVVELFNLTEKLTSAYRTADAHAEAEAEAARRAAETAEAEARKVAEAEAAMAEAEALRAELAALRKVANNGGKVARKVARKEAAEAA